jgi:hypothetical protein
VNWDIRVVRMTAAVLTALFGSLWLAFYLSAMVAPPEPEIATFGRHACIVLFFISAIWAAWLYAAFKSDSHCKDAEDAKDSVRKSV